MVTKVAVVGLGNIAARHRRNVKQLWPQAQVFAMSASGRQPEESLDHCDQLVESILPLSGINLDLAIIASPAPFHAQHALPFIHAGVPTLIEKPVSTSLEDAQAIASAAAQTGTQVAVGYCLRFLPSATRMRELINQHKVGHVYNVAIDAGQYLPHWRPNKDFRDSVSANKKLGGGALLELSHEFDYCQWLFGPLTIQHVHLRSTSQLNLEVEDCADIVATTACGAVVNVHLDFVQRRAHRTCRVMGSEGVLTWDLIRNEIAFADDKGAEPIYSNPDWDKNGMYVTMLERFLAGNFDDASDIASVQDAITTVQLINAIRALDNHAQMATEGK